VYPGVSEEKAMLGEQHKGNMHGNMVAKPFTSAKKALRRSIVCDLVPRLREKERKI
jgi:hypothetical protein